MKRRLTIILLTLALAIIAASTAAANGVLWKKYCPGMAHYVRLVAGDGGTYVLCMDYDAVEAVEAVEVGE